MKLTSDYLKQVYATLSNENYCTGCCDLCFYKAYHGTVASCCSDTVLETATDIVGIVEKKLSDMEII